MFQLDEKEADLLVSQNVIPSKRSLGGSIPYAFTQEGVAMVSSVLRSERAVRVNIEIMRAFVRLRTLLAGNAELARRQLRYVHENPVRKGLVLNPHDWWFSSARNYAGLSPVALEIDAWPGF